MKVKDSFVRVATGIWLVGLVLTELVEQLSIPPANLPLYLGLAGIAIIPLFFGSRRYQYFGIVAVVVSLTFACFEYEAGLHEAQTARFWQKIAAQQSATNTPTTLTNNH
jgi:hypothetical protein